MQEQNSAQSNPRIKEHGDDEQGIEKIAKVYEEGLVAHFAKATTRNIWVKRVCDREKNHHHTKSSAG
jgi:hypothetical protein